MLKSLYSTFYVKKAQKFPLISKKKNEWFIWFDELQEKQKKNKTPLVIYQDTPTIGC